MASRCTCGGGARGSSACSGRGTRYEKLTLKTLRASAAAALAKARYSVGHILRAGEWRSAAFLRYADVEALDPMSLLGQVMDASDQETEA